MDKLQEDFISSYTLHRKPITNDYVEDNNRSIIEGFNTDYGLILANIPENKRSYSSIWGNNRVGTGHARSTINSPQAWSSRYNSVGQWIKMDLGADVNIGGIAIQGRSSPYHKQYVTQFHIKLQKENGKYIGSKLNQYEPTPGYRQKSYRGKQTKTKNGYKCQRWDSQRPHRHGQWGKTGTGRHNYCRNPDNSSGGIWCYTTNKRKRWDYCKPKTILSGVFYRSYQGSSAKKNTVKNIMFNKIERARYVWIYPVKWSGHMSLRCDVYTTKTAKYDLIVGNHPENSRTYSSIWGNNRIGTGHARSMINSAQAWSAKSRSGIGEWMVINMGYEKKIGGIIIGSRKGRYKYQYVTKITVSTKSDTGEWVNQLIDVEAITRPGEIKKIEFNGIVLTQYVKITILGSNSHPSMRADVLLVDDKTNQLTIDRKKLNKKYIKLYEDYYENLKKQAKAYIDNIENSNKGKNAKYDKLAAELKEIKSKLDTYREGATKFRSGILRTYSDDMALDKEQLNNHFNNSYQYLNDITSDIGLDNSSLQTGLVVLQDKKKRYEHNKKILDNLDNIIDTHTRQKNLQIDYLFSGDDNYIFIKLITICLLLVVFVYILSYYKILNKKQSSYVAYGVFILFGGIALIKIIKTLSSKNKSTDIKPMKNKSSVKNP